MKISAKKYLQFVLAKQFSDLHGELFSYHRTSFEKLGEKLLIPFTRPIEILLKLFHWQFVIMGIVLFSLIGATLFYYPDQVAGLIEWIVPIIKREQAKFLGYLLVQLYLNGLLIRTLGRFSNRFLIQAWTNEVVIPLLPGNTEKGKER